ncbi:methyltransferase family protein [Microbacterium murale]|uniref:Protein-S-isoprenylcysteine O-methyltransferase Ste14 n=1 Tax=Microbacterium murale TaxID=1081040 RepID=A0ABU0P5K8_9MICO|nr:isoprenylcysteine carboxylmethyltransferase family protein [Microbacterium murale]MDQ0641996.1 protein-S-isoprenylcysteine O-methyltransferase Ste14 [Microbacterium murale]
MPALRLDARAGRLYFAMQSLAGIGWWIGVFLSDSIRTLTLGELSPTVVAWFDIPLFVIGSALVACGVRRLVWVVASWTVLVSGGMALYATFTGLAGWGALLMIAAAVGSVAAGLLVWLGRLPTEWILFGPFAIRLAPVTSTSAHVARTTGQVIAFWGLFLAVFPVIIAFVEHRWNLHLPLPDPTRWAGAALLLAASMLGIWSAAAMSTRGEGTPLPSATARRLVIAGPYRFVRNPMALAGIAQGVAVGLIIGSWLVVVYALCGSLVWNWIVRPLEEADLGRRFGSAYLEYARAVRCWLPRLTPFLPDGEHPVTQRRSSGTAS